MSFFGKPFGNVGNSVSTGSPHSSQCPVVLSFPRDTSAILPKLARGEATRGTPSTWTIFPTPRDPRFGSVRPPTARPVFPSVLLPSSLYLPASGSSPTPTPSRTMKIMCFVACSRCRRKFPHECHAGWRHAPCRNVSGCRPVRNKSVFRCTCTLARGAQETSSSVPLSSARSSQREWAGRLFRIQDISNPSLTQLLSPCLQRIVALPSAPLMT